MSNTSIENFKFNVISIEQHSFFLRNIPMKFKKELNLDLLKYEIKEIKLSLDLDEECISTTTTITAKYNDEDFIRTIYPNSKEIRKEEIITLMQLVFEVKFLTSPISHLLIKEGENITISQTILPLLTEMTLSTARGMIYSKCAGSVIAEKPLPYITGGNLERAQKKIP
ncbi:MAG: Unknown protein [uncultured Sulfurovum sp.]|uniref:Uncharacterized protein n=1 Tax=uncultured Sulfurovum sp. TaxID=269237 RepID=A0A6S6TNH1_9BACT|nr:MAG: Unknown protein [uncultured Sulfurovum sp.]